MGFKQYFSDIILETTKKFLSEKKWFEYQCSECGKTFFMKSPTRIDKPICGWHNCGKGNYSFRTLSKCKKKLKPFQISKKMSEFFNATGFGSVNPQNIAESHGQTDLIIAGVQMFDDIIHRNQPLCDGKVFVAQPCVRMQFQPQVETQEGVSTSFVNICTEQMGASISEHLQSVDCWCTALSRMGLHMNDFVIVLRTSQNDWGTGNFFSTELFFCYGGLELGDAAYFQIPQINRPAISISDIGFGLERIAWAINKTESYFDTLVPWTVGGTWEMFDACRTVALLTLCGVRAANKGSGFQFRRFAKVLGEKYYRPDLLDILRFYFDYWIQFITPSIERENAVMLAQLEIERFVNLKICKALGFPSPCNETTDAYLNRLVYTYNVSIDEIRKAIQICKI